MIYDNIWELLCDMKLNNSGEILCADQLTCLSFGWVDQNTERVWEIKLQDVKLSIEDIGDEDTVAKVIKHFSTPGGRSKILELLNDLPHLERLCKLKAFW
jgi:hypothetical protein